MVYFNCAEETQDNGASIASPLPMAVVEGGRRVREAVVGEARDEEVRVAVAEDHRPVAVLQADARDARVGADLALGAAEARLVLVEVRADELHRACIDDEVAAVLAREAERTPVAFVRQVGGGRKMVPETAWPNVSSTHPTNGQFKRTY